MISGLNGFIFCFTDTIKTIDDFPKDQGIIQYILRQDPCYIKLKNGRSYKFSIQQFETINKKTKKGQQAIVWYSKRSRLLKQLTVDGEMVLPYTKYILVNIILMIFGLFLFVGHLIYIINFKKYEKKIFCEKVINNNKKQTKYRNLNNIC
jgi:hypothetical protein